MRGAPKKIQIAFQCHSFYRCSLFIFFNSSKYQTFNIFVLQSHWYLDWPNWRCIYVKIIITAHSLLSEYGACHQSSLLCLPGKIYLWTAGWQNLTIPDAHAPGEALDGHVVVVFVVVVVLVVIRIVGDFTSVVPCCLFNAPSKTKAFVVFSILISCTRASINFSFCLFFPPGQTFGGWDLSLHSDPSWWKHHPLYNRVIMTVIKWRGWQPQWQVRPPSRNGNGASYAFVWLQGAGTERNPLQVITGTS